MGTTTLGKLKIINIMVKGFAQPNILVSMMECGKKDLGMAMESMRT